jgi:hypothetical protein
MAGKPCYRAFVQSGALQSITGENARHVGLCRARHTHSEMSQTAQVSIRPRAAAHDLTLRM